MKRLIKEINEQIAHIKHGDMEDYHHGAVKAFEIVLNRIEALRIEDEIDNFESKKSESKTLKINIKSK